MEILQNLGNGSFVTRALYLGTSSPIAAAAADFGNDGHVDLVLSDASNSAVTTIPATATGRSMPSWRQ